MNAPNPGPAERLPPAQTSDVESKSFPKVGNDLERIRSSIVRLTSTSVDGLQGLTAELQELQIFLKSEVERVQAEIESALSGIRIIIETIGPWKGTSAPAANIRPTSAGPVANVHRSGERENGVTRAR